MQQLLATPHHHHVLYTVHGDFTKYDYIQYIVIVMSGPCKLPLYTEINAEHELELLSKSGININS